MVFRWSSLSVPSRSAVPPVPEAPLDVVAPSELRAVVAVDLYPAVVAAAVRLIGDADVACLLVDGPRTLNRRLQRVVFVGCICDVCISNFTLTRQTLEIP